MTTKETSNARLSAVDLIAKGRERIADARNKANAARAATIYTPEGAEEIAVAWAKEARKSARSAIQKAHDRVDDARLAAEGALTESLTVSDAELARAATVLGPVINAASDNPTLLIRAYERRAADSLPERLLLEEVIQASIDGRLGGYEFAEEWRNVKLRTDVASDEERSALEDLAAIQGLEDYVNAAEADFEDQLGQIETGTVSYRYATQTIRHMVAKYERAVEEDTVDEEVEPVRQVVELEPQEIPEAVQRDKEARAAAMAAVV